ncbi:MAG TPA: ABC transporter transmembrane domain-containing protein, partial [Micavibrio sp.]
SLGLPLLTLQVYDRILPNPGSGTLNILMMALCVVVTLEVTLRLARTYLISWKGAAFEYETMSKAVKRILNSDLTVVNAAGVGENLNRLTAISRLREFYNGYTLITFIDLGFALVFMGLIAYIGGWLALIPAAIMAAFFVTSYVYGLQLKSALVHRDDSDDRRYNFIIGALEGIHTLKAMALENHFMRRYERHERASTLSNYDVTMAASSSFNAASVYAHMIIAATIAGGALMVLQGQLSSGGLIACVLLSGRLMQPVQRSLGLWARYQDFQVAQEKANQILELPQVRWRNSVDESPMVGSGVSTLSLRDVGFYIHAQNRWVFNKVNLHVKQGMCIHISGGHGAGRTTLLNMIAGIYRPSDGQILIEGQPIQNYDREELGHKVGLIGAHNEIFRGTISDNLTRFGLTSIDEMRDLLEMLGIERDVSKLALGYDTFLHGTEPDSITPGLKQRIAIARVLALRPKVILFDDADRNLDRNGYKNIISTLGRLRRDVCIILVTDDKYIARLAQFYFELTAGGLVIAPPPGFTPHGLAEETSDAA